VKKKLPSWFSDIFLPGTLDGRLCGVDGLERQLADSHGSDRGSETKTRSRADGRLKKRHDDPVVSGGRGRGIGRGWSLICVVKGEFVERKTVERFLWRVEVEEKMKNRKAESDPFLKE